MRPTAPSLSVVRDAEAAEVLALEPGRGRVLDTVPGETWRVRSTAAHQRAAAGQPHARRVRRPGPLPAGVPRRRLPAAPARRPARAGAAGDVHDGGAAPPAQRVPHQDRRRLRRAARRAGRRRAAARPLVPPRQPHGRALRARGQRAAVAPVGLAPRPRARPVAAGAGLRRVRGAHRLAARPPVRRRGRPRRGARGHGADAGRDAGRVHPHVQPSRLRPPGDPGDVRRRRRGPRGAGR